MAVLQIETLTLLTFCSVYWSPPAPEDHFWLFSCLMLHYVHQLVRYSVGLLVRYCTEELFKKNRKQVGESGGQNNEQNGTNLRGNWWSFSIGFHNIYYFAAILKSSFKVSFCRKNFNVSSLINTNVFFMCIL